MLTCAVWAWTAAGYPTAVERCEAEQVLIQDFPQGLTHLLLLVASLGAKTHITFVYILILGG
jgi:hypothetical protein